MTDLHFYAGVLTDDVFDGLYPREVRRMSLVHWTPVPVALRASALLAPEPGMRVLDVGAGAGKMCCIGALASGSIWHGIERSQTLVETANATAKMLGVDRSVVFTAGEMTSVRWSDFASLYFYNPFEAATFHDPAPSDPVPRDVVLARFVDEVTATEERLAEMPTGTRVVTYHGFGGTMPTNYALVSNEVSGTDHLALWVKRAS